MINRWIESCTDGLGSRFFHAIHSNHLIYNTCWEDPALDRVALDLGPSDRLLMITSAGCNALDYALTGPEHINSVDVNPRQNALLQLKIAGIRTLDFETFFQIFGRGRHREFPGIYSSRLRPALDPRYRAHWDQSLDYFTERTSFYFRGTSGTLARAVNSYIDIRKIREKLLALFEAGSVERQRALYYGDLKRSLLPPLLGKALSLDWTLSLIGVPRAQRLRIESSFAGGVASFIEHCLDTVCARLPLGDNYFWWLYLCGEYTETRCPEYLKKANFEKLRDGLVDRITTHDTTLLEFLRRTKANFSKFTLLDHMDWLWVKQKGVLRDEWEAILDRSTPDARAIWRSAGLETDFLDELPIRSGRGRKTRPLSEFMHYRRELASSLHQRDRVHTYGSFHIADLQRRFA